jgi:cyclopropane fatty-acyl-phospholipid synthase-like methyltransferase
MKTPIYSNRSSVALPHELAFWEESWRNPAFKPFWLVDGPHQLIREAIEEHWLAPHCSVLEIGCGIGQGTNWLARQGFAVLGLDFSFEAISRARKAFPDVPFAVLDVAVVQTLGRTFDAIIDSGCFHVLTPHQQTSYLANVARWSNTATKFLLLVPGRGVSPEARFHRIKQQFNSQFVIDSYQAKAGCLSQDSAIVMMTVRMIKR